MGPLPQTPVFRCPSLSIPRNVALVKVIEACLRFWRGLSKALDVWQYRGMSSTNLYHSKTMISQSYLTVNPNPILLCITSGKNPCPPAPSILLFFLRTLSFRFFTVDGPR